MSRTSEEIIYTANYKNKFVTYMDLFAMKSREPARGELRNLESDLFDARMDLKNKLNFDDLKVAAIQEKALKDYLLDHEPSYVEKLRIILYFGMMKYAGEIENLQAILEL